jgi:hypothetical protein
VDEMNFRAASGGFDARRLPVFAPNAGLWSRIEAAHRAQAKTQRWRLGGLAAAAAVLGGIGVLMLPHTLPTLSQDILAGQRESQALEGEWRQLVGSAHPTLGTTAQLRVIDAELQAAYDRGAQTDELAPLWQERNRALRGLISRFQDGGARDALAVTRI